MDETEDNLTGLFGAPGVTEHARLYEPSGIILHPDDWDYLTCTEQVANAAEPYRRSNQMRIADAFGIPYWIAGVDGFKPPWRVRLRRLRLRLWRRLTLHRWRQERRWAREEDW